MADGADGRFPAPAKLNLFLRVLGRRADGYHELQTLFQLLDWGDEVSIEPLDEPVIVRARALPGIAEDEDLAMRAARLLQAECGVRSGARIAVTKRIPAGAGLGGGSSDAATVLRALNRLWNCGLDDDALATLGLRLGADVPVFVRGRSALATGVGERLEPVSLGERHYLLLMPDFAVSTAAIFADPELVRDSAPLPVTDAPGASGNDCEAVALRRHPALREIFDDLAAHGEPRLTGTGSAVFIACPDRATAKAAATTLQCRYNVRAVRGVDRSALLARTAEQ